jgi:haloalkane dehalogenase
MTTADYPWPDRQEYCFESHYTTINGQPLHYIDEGEGEVILFVHGTPSWSFDYRKVIADLRKDHRCVAYDQIGFGLSAKPASYDYSLERHVRTLEEFADGLHLSHITLVVHDFGGPIGLEYALRHPDKVKQVVALNTWIGSSEGQPDFEKFKKILRIPLLPFLYKRLNFSPVYLLPKSFADKKNLTRHIHRQYKKPFRNAREREGMLAFARSLLRDQEWFQNQWQRSDLLKNKRFLLIWGMKDEFVKENMLKRWEDKFPDHTSVKLANTGHFPQEEAPGEVIKALRNWLEQ